jgi:hypothetical protein
MYALCKLSTTPSTPSTPPILDPRLLRLLAYSSLLPTSTSASQTPPLHGVLLETRTIDSTHSYPRDPSCFLPFPHHSFSWPSIDSTSDFLSVSSSLRHGLAVLFCKVIRIAPSPTTVSDWTRRLGYHQRALYTFTQVPEWVVKDLNTVIITSLLMPLIADGLCNSREHLYIISFAS